VFAVESINSDGTEDDAMRGKQFAELLESLAPLDDAVIDVGASNVEDFVNMMGKHRGSHEDFDYFVVPTVAKNKQLSDTISTIEGLANLGVPAKKMRVVFNMVEDDEKPERIFSGLIGYHSENKNFTLKPDAIIHMNELYGKLKGAEQSIGDILNDTTDLKGLLKAATEASEKIAITRRIATKRLAVGVTD
jgi:hypothetical protein